MKKLEEVFCDIGQPTYTYVRPAEYLQTKVALRTSGKGVIIEGPSGIGKTTCLLATLAELKFDDCEVLSARKHDDCEKVAEIVADSRDAGLVIIDDFHVLPDNIKQQISHLLKTVADERRQDIKIVLIGINNAGEHLVRISPDLTDRIETIKFGVAKEDKIEQLIQKGEKALNIAIEDKKNIIRYSLGSFHIAQLLCYSICINSEIDEEQVRPYVIKTKATEAVAARMNILERTFSDARLKFALGNRNKRRGLLPYYSLLRLIGESDGIVNLKQLYYENPRRKASFQQIINKGYLSQLIGNDSQLNHLFFFDEGSKNLIIDDPKFLFFLRNTDWVKWEKEHGFIPDYKNSYDIAISFSGKVRDIARKFAERLYEAGLDVFYDEQESAYILGQDVEKYLSPIYSADSHYVVPIIENSYAEHVWTVFEQSQYAHRYTEGSVIPLILSSYIPRYDDSFFKRGHIKIDLSEDVDSQIEYAVQMLKTKIEE